MDYNRLRHTAYNSLFAVHSTPMDAIWGAFRRYNTVALAAVENKALLGIKLLEKAPSLA